MRFQASSLVISLSLTMLAACGDDDSFISRSQGLPGEVADMDELESYACSDEFKGEKVYVADLKRDYECDGDRWVRVDDEETSSSSSARSSSSDRASSSSIRSSSSSVRSSSSLGSSSSTPYSSVSFDFTKDEAFNSNVQYGELKDARDGHVYKTVTVGRQVWMAEDLAFEYVVNDEPFENYCGTDSCKILGRYYTWAAAMDSAGIFGTTGKGCGMDTKCSPAYPARGICPEGWHVPTNQEYNSMILYAGGSYEAALKIKSQVGWKDSLNSDIYGLSFLPGGRSTAIGNIKDISGTFSWTSTEYDEKFAAWFILSSRSAGIVYNHTKNMANAVRCIKDTLVEDSFYDTITIAQPCRTEQEDNCTYGEFTDPRDNQVYKTIKIGNQVWFAENLKYETSISRCYANDCDLYGRYYLWRDIANNGGDLCPAGSHMPSKEEWETLFWAVSGANASGAALKSSTWRKRKEVDHFGFSALPAREFYGSSWGNSNTDYAEFWSSTKGENGVYSLSLFDDSDVCYLDEFKNYTSDYMYAIRCIVDSE